ncbi:LytTR family DNA-binding domain-containing protein [Tissierella pigra]|uniref:Response regulator transcription factor n=1 Tax=Tissierella pigra TaxID=2607614 RepID=A0A6N7XYB7_9FIRM|nr:LytTR family DNA-binding domain-containing protein [Tissierella pigra]MBU5425777.1 LytTR family DNA-binding domain-containing protein [Tissierella pigra]MSU01485.1 response regulator transcription factor [Tissierella pigra]
MLRIAICDDENSICNQLEEILERFQKKSSKELQIDIFHSGEELCLYLSQDNHYDIIFLDIELKEMNGVEVGQIIRDKMLNETTQIIYISGKETYAMELFKVRPLDFIIKPFNYNKIQKVLEIALRIIQRDEKVFQYKVGHTTYNLPIRDIIYFESKNREVIIHTINGSEVFYGRLKNIYEDLNQSKFIHIHKSYLVNYNHIIKLEYHQVTMSNKVILPISQANRKKVRELQLELERDRIWH